jgi:hypothetical protein
VITICPDSLIFSTTADGASSPTERMRIDSSGNLKFNSGYGSVATAYGCRAWVNFNGTGTVAIRASGNVSSITDNGDWALHKSILRLQCQIQIILFFAAGHSGSDNSSNAWDK